mmetsp:Transcript_2765/g.9012  ORF Transcript_2765/g.9012 Transcript_2765/m.9012 type:complete len:262 (-) Transcript_2765:2933-3718(-)
MKYSSVAKFGVTNACPLVALSRAQRNFSSRLRRIVPVANAAFVNADAIVSCRITHDDITDFASVEFLAKTESNQKIWLSATNVSEDLRNDYERAWWRVCREGGDNLLDSLKAGGDVLVLARDKQQRSGLHYACGLGDADAVRALISCGAEVDAQDIDGYSPLHIAAGYVHENVIKLLMASGADPSLEDNTGRSALMLLETLLENTPATTASFSKRLAMDAVATSLRSFMFEEVVPDSITCKRSDSNERSQFLVSWMDGKFL